MFPKHRQNSFNKQNNHGFSTVAEVLFFGYFRIGVAVYMPYIIPEEIFFLEISTHCFSEID